MNKQQFIYFSIPNFLFLNKLNLFLIDLKIKESNFFYEDIVIDSCYGSFPGAIWNGGRKNYTSIFYDFKKIENIIKLYNDRNVSIRLTFTNSLLKNEHLNDTFCNSILNHPILNNGKNGCTINSPILMEYIQKNFQQYYTIWSTTLENKDINKINELTKNNLLVVPFSLNNDFKKIKLLQNKNNIEFLAAEENCIDNCPYRKEHYKQISAYNLHMPYSFSKNKCGRQIENPQGYYYSTISSRKGYIDIENIRKNYLPIGFNKFKISGRTESKLVVINTIENYINFFIKPEYRNEIRNKLLIKCFCDFNY